MVLLPFRWKVDGLSQYAALGQMRRDQTPDVDGTMRVGAVFDPAGKSR